MLQNAASHCLRYHCNCRESFRRLNKSPVSFHRKTDAVFLKNYGLPYMLHPDAARRFQIHPSRMPRSQADTAQPLHYPDSASQDRNALPILHTRNRPDNWNLLQN